MGSNTMKCIVTQTLEINQAGWFRWKTNHCSKFEKTIPYALLSQVAGRLNISTPYLFVCTLVKLFLNLKAQVLVAFDTIKCAFPIQIRLAICFRNFL